MTDDVRPWEDITDEEKGALLLALYEGKVIEAIDPTDPDDIWEECYNFLDYYAYRVKPETVREIVTLMIDDGGMAGPKPIGTIQTKNGKPDCSTIKMEEL